MNTSQEKFISLARADHLAPFYNNLLENTKYLSSEEFHYIIDTKQFGEHKKHHFQHKFEKLSKIVFDCASSQMKKEGAICICEVYSVLNDIMDESQTNIWRIRRNLLTKQYKSISSFESLAKEQDVNWLRIVELHERGRREDPPPLKYAELKYQSKIYFFNQEKARQYVEKYLLK